MKTKSLLQIFTLAGVCLFLPNPVLGQDARIKVPFSPYEARQQPPADEFYAQARGCPVQVRICSNDVDDNCYDNPVELFTVGTGTPTKIRFYGTTVFFSAICEPLSGVDHMDKDAGNWLSIWR